MRPTVFSADVLRRFLRRNHIATLPQLKQLLGTGADITVFRKLKELSYRTSYSHRGSFYTLDEIARFDEQGLWSFDSVWFARMAPWWPPRRTPSRSPTPAICFRARGPPPCAGQRNPCCNWSRKVGSPARPCPASIFTAPRILECGGIEKRGDPVLSVDAKKRELIGNFKWAHQIVDVHAVQVRSALGTGRDQSDATGSGEECQQALGKAVRADCGGG